MIIVVASTNPAKILAVRRAFETAFQAPAETRGVAVSSGVAEQPLSNEETLRGALNRARNARLAFPEGDYWVGIEGGVEETPAGMEAFGWAVACSPKMESQARSASFPLPPTVARRIKNGGGLGPIMYELFN